MRDSLDLSQFRSVLFQTLYALYVAGEELEFNHNDLHLKNILLKSMKPGDYNQHVDDNITWFTTSFEVKICDFGLSRYISLT
jgi:serine/threonine protein kinase